MSYGFPVRAPRPDKWHYVGDPGEPPFENSWTNFDAAATRRARFRKDPLTGMVIVAGLIKSGTAGTVAFTFPVGYRPSLTAVGDNLIEVWVISVSNGTADCYIGPDGTLKPTLAVAGPSPTTLTSLNGIAFYTD